MLSSLGIQDQEREVLKALNRGSVEYLLIGGYAMRYYGATRSTTDVDLLAGQVQENARKLYRTIEKLVGHSPGFTQAMLMEPKQKVTFRGDGYRVSILTSVDGLTFEAAYQERTHGLEKGVVIPVASRKHLAFIKRVAAGVDVNRREMELRDIAFLESDGTVERSALADRRSRGARPGR